MMRAMALTAFVRTASIALVVFLMLDMAWLGIVARGTYARHMGHILAEHPRWGSALLFYAIFIAGLVHFVIQPALASGSLRSAVIEGAIFGLVTYATYDLTSHAVLADFPGAIVPIDIAWGVMLSAAVSAATVVLSRALPGG